MNLFKIAWRSVQQRSLSSILTGLSMALGVALVVMVLVILDTVDSTFKKNSSSWDMILGAKGSKLQLVLNTVFHLSTPVENIPYWYYKEQEEKFSSPAFSQLGKVTVIPVCMGDSYEGHRVVATIPRMFEVPYAGTAMYEFAEGRKLRDVPGHNEAVIGSVAANNIGLKVGDKINPSHGISDGGDGHEHDAFIVVGILAPTGTPNDRAVFINMEGFYLQEGHELSEELAKQRQELRGDAGDGQPDDEEAHNDEQQSAPDDGHDHSGHVHPDPLPEELREVTAILIRFDRDQAALSSVYSMNMVKNTNKGNVAQAVVPLREITNLFNTFIEPLRSLLMFLAILIVIVAGIGIMVSIYNTMNERKRDIAVMRALGAGRMTVMVVILFESLILAIGGGLCGFLLGHLAIGVVSSAMAGTTGVEIPFWLMSPNEGFLLLGLIILAAIAGFWPALSAYRTDVSRSLTATP